MATKLQILETLETLGAVYDREPGNVDAYYWVLEDYDAATLERAARQHVKTSKWFPKPSELVQAAERERNPERPPGDENVTMFWQAMSVYFDEDREQDKSFQWWQHKTEFVDADS